MLLLVEHEVHSGIVHVIHCRRSVVGLVEFTHESQTVRPLLILHDAQFGMAALQEATQDLPSAEVYSPFEHDVQTVYPFCKEQLEHDEIMLEHT